MGLSPAIEFLKNDLLVFSHIAIILNMGEILVSKQNVALKNKKDSILE